MTAGMDFGVMEVSDTEVDAQIEPEVDCKGMHGAMARFKKTEFHSRIN